MTVVEQVLAPVVTERERRARVLEAAALEIEVRGWATGWVCNMDGEVCAGGAVIAALGDSFPSPRLVIGPDWDRLEEVWGNGRVLDLPEFNDYYARAADDVTFVLRWRAAEIRDGR